MATIPQLQIPQMGAVSGGADFSPLASLPQLYQKYQQDQANKAAFATFQQTGDPQALIGSGDMNLAQLGIRAQQHQDELKQQAIANQRAQQNSDRTYEIQKRTADRQDQTPEETATERAKAAIAQGLKPDDPRFKTFVLTGKLPEMDTSLPVTIEQRKQAAIANGLDPSSPGFQSFVLTGKMPREDAQPLTATDKKAILEADEKVQAGNQTIDNLNQAKVLSQKAYAGLGAGARGYAGSLVGAEGGVATEDLHNLVTSNALQQLKTIFGGNPTEGERGILLDIQGSVNKPDAVRQKIYDRAIAAAQKRLTFEKQRADELRGGSFYKPGDKRGGTSQPQEPAAAAPAAAPTRLKFNPQTGQIE